MSLSDLSGSLASLDTSWGGSDDSASVRLITYGSGDFAPLEYVVKIYLLEKIRRIIRQVTKDQIIFALFCSHFADSIIPFYWTAETLEEVSLTIAEEERDECDMWLRLPSILPPWIR